MTIVTKLDLLKIRRTKIIATVGPTSYQPETIHQLILEGVNVFRQNMSHGDHDFHRETYSTIRKIAKETNLPIAILADLCGPKIRTGKFRDGSINLLEGETVVVTTRDIMGEAGLIPSQYQALADDVKANDRILLNDGALELKVKQINKTEIECTVLHGGVLKNHKGINLPGVNVSAPSLTEKDKEDARFMLDLGVDFLALSFVRSAKDIDSLRQLIQQQNAKAHIVAKIEKPEALDHASAIIDAADAIMVARGDLGVELSPEQVPVAQSELIDMARRRFKPVIVATQMLESMIENARPTRAEVTDISYAVTLGTDAVMLSAETAAGAFPIKSVQMMDRIIRQTESYLWTHGIYGQNLGKLTESKGSVWDAMANTTSHLSKNVMARAVLVISQSGVSAATMSSARPAAPVVGITSREDVCRKMALMWSVIPLLSDDAGNINPNILARQIAKDLKIAEEGENILLVRGFHSNSKKNTPSVTVICI